MSQDTNPQPPEQPPGAGLRRTPIDFAGVIREMMILTCGLLGGFVWTMANYQASEDNVDFNIFNVIIGLFILICILARYFFLAKIQTKITDADAIVRQFVMEIVVLIPAVIGGYFWYTFYDADGRDAVHIVMLLIVMIFGLARVVFKVSQSSKS